MEFIQQNWYLIAIATMSGGGLLYLSLRGPGGNSLSTTQATLLINRENALVIDISEAGEYENGHLPDARNIPSAQLADRAAEFEKYKDAPVIIACQTGLRSASACKKLKSLGFAKVYSLDGGIDAWRSAGLPVKKGNKR